MQISGLAKKKWSENIPHFQGHQVEGVEGFWEATFYHKIFCQTSILQSSHKLAYPVTITTSQVVSSIWRTSLLVCFWETKTSSLKPKLFFHLFFIFASSELELWKAIESLPLEYLHIVVTSVSIVNYDLLADFCIPGRLVCDIEQRISDN